MSALILYNYFRSSTSYRARIALHYKNLKFDYRPVHLLNDGGEQHKSEYISLNSMSEVPTLVHGKLTLSQSVAIIEYLDEVFPAPPLFPDDPARKALVRQFCENINSFLHPLSNLKVLQHLESRHGYTQDDKAQWVSLWAAKGLTALEDILKKNSGTYCFGDEITTADLFLVPQVFSAQRFKVDLNPYPLLMKINETCLKHEAFIKAHPLRQVDTPATERIS